MLVGQGPQMCRKVAELVTYGDIMSNIRAMQDDQSDL